MKRFRALLSALPLLAIHAPAQNVPAAGLVDFKGTYSPTYMYKQGDLSLAPDSCTYVSLRYPNQNQAPGSSPAYWNSVGCSASKVAFGFTAGTAAQGNDLRIVNALQNTGGTMTGPLVLAGAPTLGLHAATKTYVDAAIAAIPAASASTSAALLKAGGTMTGPLILSGPPTTGLNPATKAYVDSAIAAIPAASSSTPVVTSGGSTSSQWAGKKLCAFGDSVSANYANIWQNGIISSLGMATTIAYQSALGGRPVSAIFADYAVPAGQGAQINIYDGTPASGGGGINSNDGTILSGGASYIGYLDLRGAPTFVANIPLEGGPGYGVAYYNSSDAFISGSNFGCGGDCEQPAGTVFNVPSGAKYVRFTVSVNAVVGAGQSWGTAMVVTGSTLPSGYLAYDPSAQYGSSSGSSGGTPVDANGKTLAQNLAGCDLTVVEFGLNDRTEALGSPSDATTAATLYGYWNNAFTKLSQANPSMRIVAYGMYQSGPASNYSAAQAANVVAAEKYEAGLWGIPVIDLLHESQINAANYQIYLVGDQIHPTTATFNQILIPLVARKLLQFDPL